MLLGRADVGLEQHLADEAARGLRDLELALAVRNVFPTWPDRETEDDLWDD